MGLLDDAIREHLELKRLRGADPALVSREEHEALGAARRGEAEEDGDGFATGDEDKSAEPRSGQVAEKRGDEFAHGQETAEIDMQTVLQEEPETDFSSSGAAATFGRGTAAPVRARPAPGGGDQTAGEPSDVLDWEMPGNQPGEPEATSGDDKQAEDVLEETPDFLRDTPEQERLWFEQRPPRDFDFDR